MNYSSIQHYGETLDVSYDPAQRKLTFNDLSLTQVGELFGSISAASIFRNSVLDMDYEARNQREAVSELETRVQDLKTSYDEATQSIAYWKAEAAKPSSTIGSFSTAAINAGILGMAISGQKINAIKLWRAFTGATLRDAKDHVEGLVTTYENQMRNTGHSSAGVRQIIGVVSGYETL